MSDTGWRDNDGHEGEAFRADDLVACTDPTPVEHLGGPDDGDWLPMCENKRRPNGLYAPVNFNGATLAFQYVPDDSPPHLDY